MLNLWIVSSFHGRPRGIGFWAANWHQSDFGADLGGGLVFSDPNAGLARDLKARGLIAHEVSGFRELGEGAAVAFDPRRSAIGRGVSATLRQSWATSPAGSMDALLLRETLAGLAADGSGDRAASRRQAVLRAISATGLPSFGGAFTGTPDIGFGLSGAARDYRIGWRLTPAASGGPGFEVNLDATRRGRQRRRAGGARRDAAHLDPLVGAPVRLKGRVMMPAPGDVPAPMIVPPSFRTNRGSASAGLCPSSRATGAPVAFLGAERAASVVRVGLTTAQRPRDRRADSLRRRFSLGVADVGVSQRHARLLVTQQAGNNWQRDALQHGVAGE